MDLIADGRLPAALIVTNQSLVVGFGLAVGVGIPAGIFVARVRFVDQWSAPI